MKQVLFKSGKAFVENTPAPSVEPGTILVHVEYSCISAGTEISGVRSSGEPIWKRALKHPNEVKQVLSMISDQGIRRIHRMVKGKLTSGSALGYSAAGTVIAVGEGVSDLVEGDKVACAGAQCAHHAEVIRVPRNLVARLPKGLSTKLGSTVTLGSIALHGVRRCEPTLGESIVVVGLGILGQLTIQYLQANGCQVIGLDLDRKRIELAKKQGVMAAFHPDDENEIDHIYRLTDGYGADAVIVTAGDSSNKIMSQAFKMCRKKGRVVLVGDAGLGLNRADIFKKELEFRISTSYGPGRYDPTYEEGGIDYPISYVRWTENRNMEEYLRLLNSRKMSLDGLVTKIVDIDDAANAYQKLKDGFSDLMVLLRYPERSKNNVTNSKVVLNVKPVNEKLVRLGVIGAGSFAKGMHLPNIERFKKIYYLKAIMSRTGHNSKVVADQFNAEYATTDLNTLLSDKELDAVVITSRHDQHGKQVLESLKAGKHVFVEKPLTISLNELGSIKSFYKKNKNAPLLLTGFNRRFSPHISHIKKMVSNRSNPMIINYRMNAGHVLNDNWVHGKEGGGRNLGEACHIYDLFTHLTNSKVNKINAHSINPVTDYYGVTDNFVAVMSFEDGSVATLTYNALGAKDYAKEQMEIYFDGKVIKLDDYLSVDIYGVSNSGLNTKTMQKGQTQEIKAFGEAILNGGEWPIPFWQQVQATEIAFEVEKQISNNSID